MSDQNVKGTVIRGADGKLYFIPDGVLETYRIPEQEYPAIAPALAAHGIDIDGQDEHAQRVVVDNVAAMGMNHGIPVDNAAAMGMIHEKAPVDTDTDPDANQTPVDNAAAQGIIHQNTPVDDALASEDQRETIRKLTD